MNNASVIAGWKSIKPHYTVTLRPGRRLPLWPWRYRQSDWRVLRIDGFEDFMKYKMEAV